MDLVRERKVPNDEWNVFRGAREESSEKKKGLDGENIKNSLLSRPG